MVMEHVAHCFLCWITMQSKAHNEIVSLIKEFDLDLTGFNVYTEAATGPYGFTAIIAALAGAKHVTAQAESTAYGDASVVIRYVENLAEVSRVSGKVSVVHGRDVLALKSADIITNSGNVRPFNSELIELLHPQAVIPLMWETWEHRPDELDLTFCKKKNILVLGTNEGSVQCNFEKYVVLGALKLLSELNYDGGPLMVLGNDGTPGKVIVEGLRRLGIKIYWFSGSEKSDYRYADLRNFFLKNGANISHLLLAEHEMKEILLGSTGFLDAATIMNINADLKIANFAGQIKMEEVIDAQITIYPDTLAPINYINYPLSNLGSRPVLHLMVAGLKVGEQMAKARREFDTVESAALSVIYRGLAMDFPGKKSWLNNSGLKT